MSAEKLRLVAMREVLCDGDLGKPVKRHPDCNGEIWEGEQYFERDPKPEKFGTRHCLKCHEMFFPKD